jgi:DNA polymerase V
LKRGSSPHTAQPSRLVALSVLDGELTIKRLRITPTGVVLQAENPSYPDIEVAALSDLTIWGVATMCLHHV